jgi:Ca2+-binding RTX toxin-like protein
MARALKLNSRWDARDDDVDAPPDHGFVSLLPDGFSGDVSRAAQPSLTIGKDAPELHENPAFPFPAGDFDSIPPGPTHSIGAGNLDELMDYLNKSGETWAPNQDDGAVLLRISFPQSYDDIPEYFRWYEGFDSPADAAASGLAFFNPAQKAYALQAAQAWADMAMVRFEEVGPGEEADIYFYGRNFNDGAAFSSGIDAMNGSRVAINVADGWPDMQPGLSGFRILMHEIGHSLGLSHPGDYDVGEYTGYWWDAEYIEDTKMYTLMSYNSGTYTGFEAGGRNPGTITPRSHDAYVIHQLYGANWDTRAGNSTYGYNAAGVGASYDFTNYDGPGEPELPLMTIWDGGGVDWLDLSGDSSGVTLDLRPGAFSSTHGMTYNISLAYVPDDAPDDLAGYIENARGGAGDDTLIGNIEANHLVGGAGNDVLAGLDGNDTLDGGSGNDTLKGGGGNDTLNGGLGDDTMAGEAGNDTYYVDSAGDEVIENFNEGYDVVRAKIDYTLGDNVEGLVLEGIFNLAGTGSSADNAISGNAGNNTLDGRGGEDLLTGNGGHDTFRFQAYEADGDAVRDFAGNGAAAGDSFLLVGFGTAEQGATFTQINASQWQIHSGLDGHDEIITLKNLAAVHASDVLFV